MDPICDLHGSKGGVTSTQWLTTPAAWVTTHLLLVLLTGVWILQKGHVRQERRLERAGIRLDELEPQAVICRSQPNGRNFALDLEHSTSGLSGLAGMGARVCTRAG